MLLALFVENYPREEGERREKWFDIIESVSKVTHTANRINTRGNDFEDLPLELVWEMLLFLSFEDLRRLFLLKKEYYEKIFERDNFWKMKFEVDFVYPIIGKDKKYEYPKFIMDLFDPKGWKKKYIYFFKKLGEFIDLNNRIIYDSFRMRRFDKKSALYKISLLQNIFKKRKYESGVDWSKRLSHIGVDYVEYLCDDHKFKINFEDKLFIMNIINPLGKEIKRIQEDHNPSLYGILNMETVLLDYMLCCFDYKLKNSKDIFWSLIKITPHTFEYSGEVIKRDRSIILYVVKDIMGFGLIKDTPFVDDKEVVLEAIKKDDFLKFEYISKRLRGDKEVVLAALKSGMFLKILEHTSNYLKGDKEVILAAVSRKPSSLKHASKLLKDDEEVVLAAFSRKPSSLKHASPRLQQKINEERKSIFFE